MEEQAIRPQPHRHHRQNLENPFFVEIFHSLEEQAHQAGFEILVGNTNYAPERLAACIDLFLGRRVAGLAIIVSERVDPVYARKSSGRPAPGSIRLRLY